MNEAVSASVLAIDALVSPAALRIAEVLLTPSLPSKCSLEAVCRLLMRAQEEGSFLTRTFRAMTGPLANQPPERPAETFAHAVDPGMKGMTIEATPSASTHHRRSAWGRQATQVQTSAGKVPGLPALPPWTAEVAKQQLERRKLKAHALANESERSATSRVPLPHLHGPGRFRGRCAARRLAG